MNNWFIILGMGLITYLIRLTPIMVLERFELSPRLYHALKFVPVAVLSAIILPAMLMPDEIVWWHLDNGRLWAGLLAIFIAWRTKNILWTIGMGMVALWLLQWLT